MGISFERAACLFLLVHLLVIIRFIWSLFTDVVKSVLLFLYRHAPVINPACQPALFPASITPEHRAPAAAPHQEKSIFVALQPDIVIQSSPIPPFGKICPYTRTRFCTESALIALIPLFSVSVPFLE